MKLITKALLLFIATAGSVSAFVPQKSQPSSTTKLSLEKVDTSRPDALKQAANVLGRVPFGEDARKYRRTIYNYDDWVKHRSDSRFLSNLAGIYNSGVIRNLTKEVGTAVGIAAFTILFNALFNTGYDDLFLVHHDAPLAALIGTKIPLTVPLTAFTISSSALSLLLVFRTNSCYGRWDEARKQWGKTLTQARNILRQSATWASPNFEPDVQKRAQALDEVGTWTWMTMYTLAASLGTPEDKAEWEQVVRDTLNDREAEILINSRHRPSRAHLNLSRAIYNMPINKWQKLTLDANAMNICDLIGAQERLFLAPIPLVYTRFTARFLSGWVLFLPLGLYDTFKDSWNHIEMIPIVAVVSTFFFGLEELAITLEEPFSVLPMDNFWGNVKKTAFEMRDWHVKESQFWDYSPDNNNELADNIPYPDAPTNGVAPFQNAMPPVPTSAVTGSAAAAPQPTWTPPPVETSSSPADSGASYGPKNPWGR